MANEAHLARLKEGMTAWNQWRKEHCPVLRQRCALAFQRAWGTAAPAGRQELQTLKETIRKTFARLRTTLWQTMAYRHWKLLLGMGAISLLSIVLISVGFVVWKVPQWQAATWEGRMEAKDLAKLENDARTALIQAIVGGVLLLGFLATAIGLVLTWRNLQITQNTALKNLQLTQDRQITEHYTRAVEQLGSDKLELRLGAIYALERIARDSERDHWPIMEILTAYIREHAPRKETEQRSKEEGSSTETLPTQNHELPPKPTTDVQAILTVLGRRTRTYGKGEEERLNLIHTDLQRANLIGVHLAGVYLVGAHLEQAYLINAHLEGAHLSFAHLEFAHLIRAHLEGTRFDSAHLLGTFLKGAHLKGARLTDANLQWADFRGATDLTVEQLADAKTLYEAHLEVWQRFAGKWATCDPGQKPCTMEAQVLLILKGF
jgi:hypothetical protein